MTFAGGSPRSTSAGRQASRPWTRKKGVYLVVEWTVVLYANSTCHRWSSHSPQPSSQHLQLLLFSSCLLAPPSHLTLHDRATFVFCVFPAGSTILWRAQASIKGRGLRADFVVRFVADVQIDAFSKIIHYNHYVPIPAAWVAVQSDLQQFSQKGWM